MLDRTGQWKRALDQPGSADERTIRNSLAFSLIIILIALCVVLFGNIQLPAYPQFSTFYASFVFLVGAITSFVLFGQFHYRKRLAYAILASAYLFKALVALIFLLSFPGALKESGQIIGGNQSSIWVWNFWHLLFPAIVALSVLIHRHDRDRQVPAKRIGATSLGTAGIALTLALSVTLAVTQFHDQLPALIDSAKNSVTPSFYLIGGLSATVTTIAVLLCWRKGRQQRTILHIWLTVTLLAYLVDVIAALGTTMRFTVAWYFGRIEAMIAASLLLMLFLNEINTLYHRLAATMSDLITSNDRLLSLLQEKEALLADLRQSEAQVRQMAYYDPLTELPNRRLLLDRMNQALAQAKRHRHSIAIMFMDLDHFKQINDTFGHDAGDRLLTQVASRLKACLRKGDTACRSGGDEFIIVLTEIAHPQDASLVAEKVIAALHEPIDLDGHTIKASISIGIAIYPIDGNDDVRDLMQKADKAMYVAKAEGRNQFYFYSSEMEIDKPDSAEL